jgi:peptidoglycan/xylan/chitin deacetylase (PgdA/CDA1 family)
MRWDDLAGLIEQGHTIGCHTKTHARLNEFSTKDELELEIISSAQKISDNLGVNINHFAFTFGDIDSFSIEALEVAKSKFNFVYSGIRGVNLGGMSPFAIRRDAVAYQLKDNRYRLFNIRLLSVFLNGFLDFLYSPARDKIDSWCK